MEIIQVGYSKLVSDKSNFSNQAIDAQANVEIGENPEVALDHLREWVNAQFDIEVDFHKMREEKEEIENYLVGARESYKKAMDFMRDLNKLKQGEDIQKGFFEFNIDEMPF